MIVDVPAATAVTSPLVEFTVATVVVELVHVPPGDASLNVLIAPGQTRAVPVIAGAGGHQRSTVLAAGVPVSDVVNVAEEVVLDVSVGITWKSIEVLAMPIVVELPENVVVPYTYSTLLIDSYNFI